MKKLLISITVAAVLVLATPQAQAVTVEELQVQMQSLLKLVAQLQDQLAQLNGGPVTPTPTPTTPPQQNCYQISRPLYRGLQGDDVAALQGELKAKGYFNDSATGYFGPATERAVQAFQQAQGIVSSGTAMSTGYGVVGPQTKRSIWVCDDTPTEDAVICPQVMYQKPICNAGEVAQPVNSNSLCPSPWHCVQVSNQKCGVNSFSVLNQCGQGPTDEPLFRNAHIQCYDGYTETLGDATSCKSSITWQQYGKDVCAKRCSVSGGNMCSDEPIRECLFGSTKIYDSSQLCYRTQCVSGTNHPPTISSFSGPTTLSINQQGTWSVSASDPENGQLSYDIRWGDARPFDNIMSTATSAQRAFTQQTTFTHAYAQAGTYTVVMMVRDAQGQSARATVTVQVGDGTVSCTNDYKPVCGVRRFDSCPTCGAPTIASLLTTYQNTCIMNQEGARFMRDGVCPHIQNGYCLAPSPKETNDIVYGEGEKTSCIWTPEGKTCIADANYVCRNGEWKMEGGLPVSSTSVSLQLASVLSAVESLLQQLRTIANQ